MNRIDPSVRKQSFSCPHCGALAHQSWYDTLLERCADNEPQIWNNRKLAEIKSQQLDVDDEFLGGLKRLSEGEVFTENSSSRSDRALHNIFVSICYSCSKAAIWKYETLLYPPHIGIEEPNQDMPKHIQVDYDEARRIANESPRAAAALLRLCIEKICIYLKAEGNDLNAYIGFLVSKGLSSTMQKALDTVRVIGNEAVHPGTIDLNDNKEISSALFRLVNQIVQQLITDSREVNEIFEMLPDQKKESIKQRDKIL